MNATTEKSIQNELDSIHKSQVRIESLLGLKKAALKDYYIPNSIFKSETGIGRGIFKRLRAEGKLRITKRGREVWVHQGDIKRYLVSPYQVFQ